VEEAAAKARYASEIIGQEFPGWNVRVNLAVGSTVQVIAKKADEWNADLIVIGSQKKLSLEKSLSSPVSQRIASKVNCSIRVERSSGTETGVEADPDAEPRLLLCVDESPAAQGVVRAVAARVWAKCAEARLLTVVNPFNYTMVPLLDEKIKRARLMHRALTNELDETPLVVSSEVKEGEPVEVILKEAQQWNASTIFIAASWKSRIYQALAGSVSATVAAKAHCPVELIRFVEPRSGLSLLMRPSEALFELPFSKKSV
jgi:nucleotide-binding universal stress UspA family protein